jgi:hypothetical protein
MGGRVKAGKEEGGRIQILTINSKKMITTKELAMHERQNAYFSSKKENRWGDKKLLAAKNQALTAVDIVRRSELFFSGEGHYVGRGIFVEGGLEV